ncbi:MAG: hypothetical protein ACI9LE_000057 [Paraglaciecola sp.]|jgi:hypothetical protein
MKKILAWGTGAYYERFRAEIENEYIIIGFIDNNEKKQGDSFYKKTVYAPADIATLNFDMILIFSDYAQDIARQLYVMGYKKHQIFFY